VAADPEVAALLVAPGVVAPAVPVGAAPLLPVADFESACTLVSVKLPSADF
jgi:hypothetical protein